MVQKLDAKVGTDSKVEIEEIKEKWLGAVSVNYW